MGIMASFRQRLREMSSAANNSAQSRPSVTGNHGRQWAAGGSRPAAVPAMMP